MKFFSTSQIRQLDKFTIENEPIASIDLMERAAGAIYEKYLQTFSYKLPVCVFAGSGNNGGDALAVARMLLFKGLSVQVFLIRNTKLSDDCERNRQRLQDEFPNSLTELKTEFIAPQIKTDTVIIDGLLGSGLSRPLTGLFAKAVEWINQSGCKVVAIDIPSGLHGEELALSTEGESEKTSYIVKADNTFSLQFPKLAFLLPENAEFVGKWEVLDIGIHQDVIENTATDLYFLEEKEISLLLKKRPKFSHKGTFGHALVVAGSNGMAGAAVLSAKAALRSGAGLVSVHSAFSNRTILQTAIPEVIFQSDFNPDFISEIDFLTDFDAIGIGPGIGIASETEEMLPDFIKKLESPCIFDADALNIIAKYKELLQSIPENSIFTPHPKEFDRIFGPSKSSNERILKAQQASKDYRLILVLKGTHTLIALPDGKLFFNSTGNSGMATAGSGDVLTGIITGLLAQRYKPEDAVKIAVFLHGRAGDFALQIESEESLIASDLIANLGKAFKSLRD